VKTGQCFSRQYLHWTKSRPTPQFWWCRYQVQIREHLFKACPEWKAEQKILWAEVLKETGKRKSRWRIRDLLADGRCSQTVPDFLSATDAGRRVPADEGAESELPEWELRERREREEEREAEAEELDVEENWVPGRSYHRSRPRPLSWHSWRRLGGGLSFFFASFFCLSRPLGFFSFLISLVHITSSWGRSLGGGQRGACNMPPSRGQQTGNGQNVRPMVWIG